VADRAESIILGGGLAGLAAGWTLAHAGRKVLVLESAAEVGGLARTVACGEFRFDLGGHRWFTTDTRVEALVRTLLGAELQQVARASRILLRGKYIDYPLRPVNAILGLGLMTTLRILLDYARAQVARRGGEPPLISLEDWVVSRFGRELFEIYFKQYSEKVWGLDCREISAQWVARRIQGLSLGQAIGAALFRFARPRLPTLAEEFLYPRLGIGRIAASLGAGIEAAHGRVHTGARVTRVERSRRRIDGVAVRRAEGDAFLRASEFVSSIPLSALVRLLDPPAPGAVRAAAARLRWRDLVVVAVLLGRPRVTDQTWIYLPEKRVPFARLHEPTNWSAAMAPPGRTLLVAEYFCFAGDATWSAADEMLAEDTVRHLARLGFIRPEDVVGTRVLRVPQAYPLFELGYERHTQVIADYLAGFENLHLAGRGGMFQYYNMDHAMASGLEAAAHVLSRPRAGLLAAGTEPVAAGGRR